MAVQGRELQKVRLALVGETWSQQDERGARSFFGPDGQELHRQLLDSGIDRSGCLLTTTLTFRPPNDDLRNICLLRGAATPTYLRVRPELAARWPHFSWPESYDWPPMVKPSGFLHPEHLGELARLQAELLAFKPTVVLALGNLACWSLIRATGIGKLRGYIYPCTLVPGLKVLPTYHPSKVLQQYANRPIVLADIAKAVRLSSPSEELQASLRTSAERLLWIEPEFADLEAWWGTYVKHPSVPVSLDIETFGGTITCIGFGTVESAISIPLWDKRKPDRNYWPSGEVEARVLAVIQTWLASPNPKILQNSLYDLQWLWRVWGMKVNNVAADTMLQHHALMPEMSKDLNFMGATYTDVPAWKQMRKLSEAAAKRGKKDA